MKELEKSVHVLHKSIWRLNKTVLIMAKILDEQTAKETPRSYNKFREYSL